MASYPDLRPTAERPASAGLDSALRRRTILLALCLLSFITAFLAVSTFAHRTGEQAARAPAFLTSSLGRPSPAGPLVRTPVPGFRVAVGDRGFSVRHHGRTVALTTAATDRGWGRYARGVSRRTAFGRETIVVAGRRAEQFLTVERPVGAHTWRWRLSTSLTPRLTSGGVVGFVDPRTHRVSDLAIAPVTILGPTGRDVTPAGLRWSLSDDGRLLELTLDDRELPLPYTIDPGIVLNTSAGTTGPTAAAGSIALSIPSGVAVNDQLIAHVTWRNAGTSVAVPAAPSGWTLLGSLNQGASTIGGAAYRRTAQSGDAGGSVSFTLSPTAIASGGVLAYAGVSNSTAPQWATPASDPGSNTFTVTMPSLTTSAANEQVVSLIGWRQAGGTAITAPASETKQWETANSGGITSAASDRLVAGSGTTVNASATASQKSRAYVTFRLGLFEDPSTSPPTSTLTFPANGGAYRASTWTSGCASAGFCGTATDNQSGVNKVEISIRRGTGNYWNAGSFSSAAEVYQPATFTPGAGAVNWTYAFPTSNFPANGAYTVHLRAVDNAQNVQAFSTTTFTYDTTAAVTTPTFPANGGAYKGTAWDAGCATIGFCGSATDATSTVTNVELSIRRGSGNYYDGSSFAAAAEQWLPVTAFTAAATVNWSYPFAKTKFPADGTYTVHLRATDAAGNVETFQTLSFWYDTAAPVTTPSFPLDTGAYTAAEWDAGCATIGLCGSATDATSTVSNVQLSIRRGSGNYYDGSSFASGSEVYLNVAAFTPAATVNWSYAFAKTSFPADGSYTVHVKATDAAANVETFQTLTFVYDGTAPAAPTSLGTTPASPANDNAPKVTGSAEAGSTVKLYSNSTCTSTVAGTGTAAAFASPGIAVAVSDDTTTSYWATTTDPAGNVSACSPSSVTYVEDSTTPAAPTGLGTTPASPANDNAPKVTGAAEAGSTVKLYTSSDCSGAPSATGTAASFSSPGIAVAVGNDSTTTFKATTTDAAGNVSPCSSGVTYVEDSTAPAGPSGLGSTPASPANANAPKVTGTAEAGSTVRLYTNASCTSAVAASGTAAAFASPGLGVAVGDDSTTTYYATATDAAGNASACSAGLTYVEDSTAPAAPASLVSTPSSPANDNAPKLGGAAEAGSTVRLYTTSDCSGAAAGTGTAAAFASPGLAVAVANDTTTTFKATATDAAGNVSACSAGLTYVEDSTAPAAPTGLATTPASPANDNAPKLAGSAEAGATVKLYTTSDCSGAPVATGTAAAFASPGLALAVSDDSSTTFKATATDAASNTSPCSAGVAYVEDSTAPAAPTGLAPSPASPANDNAPRIAGTAEAGSTVRLYTTSDCSGAAAATGAAATFASPGLAVAVADDSSTSYRATATDLAGNASGCSAATTYVEDSTAPASTAAFPAASSVYRAATWNAGCAAAGLCGTASDTGGAGLQAVQVSIRRDGTGTFWNPGSSAFDAASETWVTAAGTTSWSYAFAASSFPADGAYTVRARARDAAGNTEAASTRTFTLDATSPTGAITAPATAWVHGASVALSSDSADAGSGVQGTLFERSPAGAGSWTTVGTDTAPPYSLTWDTTGLANGTYDVRVTTTDNAGNSVTSPAVTVGVDNAPPTSALAFTPGTRPDLQSWDAGSQTYYYNPSAAGDFTVSDAPGDTGGSGVATVGFPAVSAAGFSGAARTVSAPGPYESNAYSFASANASAPALTVTVTDGAGNATPQAATLVRDADAPTGMAATVTGGYVTSASVPVTIANGGDTGAGLDVSTRVLERDESTLADGACASFPDAWAPVTLSGGADTSVQSGRCYRYRLRISDRVANEGVSAASATVKVDTTAPAAPTLAISGLTNAALVGGTVYVRSGAAGGFTVSPTSTDAQSGIASYAYPALGSGWSRSGSDYSFDASAADPGEPNDVTAANGAGLSSSPTSFTVTPDGTAPAGMSAAVTGGYVTTASIPVALDDGTDSGSGVDPASAVLERDEAPLADGSCAGFPDSWGTVVTLVGGADTSVASGTCYRYRLRIADRVGNQATQSGTSATVRVDTSAPAAPSLAVSGLTNAALVGGTVYFRGGAGGGFTVTPSSSDAESGVDAYAYPALGSGWTRSGSDYAFDGTAADPAEPNDVTARNGAGLDSPATSLTVTRDAAAPVTTALCDGSPCSSGYYTSSPVAVTLSATDAGSGATQIRYTLDGSDPTPIAGTTYTGPIAVVATTTVRYRAYDAVGNAEAVASTTVRLDATPPTGPAVTLTESSPWESITGSELFYNPSGGHSASFGVDAETEDDETGIVDVTFPALAGMSGGGADATTPYGTTYAWDSSAGASPGAADVTARNGAGIDAATSFTVTKDDAPPTGTSASVAGGYVSTPSVAVTVATGTDAGAGVDGSTAVVERDEATLAGGSCGTFPDAWAAVTLSAGDDTTVASGTCYRYRLRVADRVGNEGVSAASASVKVDTSAPAAPGLAFSGSTNAARAGGVVWFRPGASGGFTITPTSTDAQSGIASYALPALGSGWMRSGSDYAFDASAANPAEPNDVTARNGAGLDSAATSFAVEPDSAPPATTATCDGAACVGWYPSPPVTVALAATDADSGVDRITYTLDGSDPAAENGTVYTGPFAVGATTEIRYRAWDAVGNAEPVSSLTVQVDTTAPGVGVTGANASGDAFVASGGGTVWYRPGGSGSFDLTATVTDAQSGPQRAVFPAIAGFGPGASVDAPGPYANGYSFSGTPAEPGTVTVDGFNNAGYSASASLDVRADSTAPTSSIACDGSSCAGWKTSTPVTLSLSASDGGSGVRRIRYTTDGSDPTSGGSTYAAPFTVSSTTTVKVAAEDEVGNVETVSTQLVQVDTTPPSAPTLAFSGLDNAALVGGVLYFRPGAAGGFTLTPAATDAESGVASYGLPALGAGWSRSSGDYAFSAAAADPAEPNDVTATDAAGLTSTATSFTVDPDAAAPTTTIACDGGSCAGWHTSAPVSVTLAASDAGSGVERVRYTTDGSDPTAGGTAYTGAFAVASTTTVKFAAEDAVGNVEAVGSQLVRVDTTAPSAPTLAFSGLANASVTGSTVYFRAGAGGGYTVSAASDDDESGVASYGYPSLGSGWTGAGGAYTFDASADDPAEPNDVTATNAAGLTSAPTAFTVTRDATAPASSAACDGGSCAGWHTAATAVSLTATDAGSGVDRIVYTTDGSDPTSGGTVYAAPFTVAATATVRFAAYDAVGNVEAVQDELVRVDTTRPSTPTLAYSGFTNASASGSTVWFRPGAAGGFTVTPSASDPESGVASYAYPSLGSGWTRSGGDYAFDAAAADPAEPNEVTAANGAGLVSDPAAFTVTADSAPPVTTAACDGGPCAGWHTSTPVSVTLAAGDGQSGVAQVRYTLDGSDPTVLNGVVYTGPIPVATTTQVRFRAWDAVGNAEAVASVDVEIDTSAPVVSAAAVATGGDTYFASGSGTLYYRPGGAGSFDLTASITDGQSGADRAVFPALAGFGAGATVNAPGPYAHGYSYSGTPAEPGPVSVTGFDAAGLSASASVEVRADGTDPTGGSIDYADGYDADGTVAITTVQGSDTGSGLGTGAATIERQTAALADGACGGFGAWTAASGPDTVPTGTCARYRLRVSDRVGNVATWTSPNVVRVDLTAPPAPTLTLTESSPLEHVAGTTLFYNPQGANAASFAIAATATDPESGAAGVDFPVVFGADGSTDAASPYSAVYSWTATASASGAQTVTVRNGAGLQTTGSFTVTPDTAAPAGGSVDYPDGFTPAQVTVATSDGTDGGSGLEAASAALERHTAPLAGSCGTYGAWTPVTSPDTLGDDLCAQYRYRVSDRVGNEAVYTSPNVARSDAIAPSVTLTAPAANLRRTVTLAATASDSGSGIDDVTFQIAPAGTGGWTTAGVDSTGPYTADLDTTTLGDGLYDFRAVARDVAGNSTTSTVATNRRIDNTPPAGTLTDPGSLVSGTVALDATTSDTGGSGVASVAFELSPAGAGTWSTVPASWSTPASGDGLYDLRVTVTDVAGNTSTSPVRANVRVDNTAPTVALGDPGDNVSGTVTLAATADDGAGSGIASITYAYASAGTGAWTATPAAWNTTLLPDGLYDLRTTATDRAGNATDSAAVTDVRVDNQAPTVTIAAPAPGSFVNASSPDPATVTAAAADTGSGVDHVDLFVCSNPSAACATGTWLALGTATAAPYDAPWPLPADGNRALRAVATDRAGRTAAATASVTVDRTPPETAIDVKPGDPSNLAAPSFSFSSGEAGSTFACRVDGGAFTPCTSPTALPTVTDGAHTFDVRAVDTAGNVDASPATWTWLVDLTPPTASVGDPGRFVRGTVALSSTTDDPGASASGIATVTYEYSADDGASWAATPADWDTTLVDDGLYQVRVTAADRAGNATSSDPVADVRVDNTAPGTSLDAPPANVRQTVALTGAAADDGSGIDHVTFQVSPADADTWSDVSSDDAEPYEATLDTTTLGDGLYDLRTVAVDRAGNETQGAPVEDVRVDNTAPTATMGDPGANLRRTVTLSSTSDDAGGSGVVSVQYECAPSGSGTWSPAAASWSTASVADGVYDLHVVVTDAAGNQTVSGSVSSRVDNTAPVTSDDAPSGWQSSAVTVTLSASDAGSGASATQYSVDGAAFQSGTSVAIAAPGDGSNDGAHTIAYFSTDVVGNVEQVKATSVLIDASGPGARPNDPGAYLRGTVTLSADPGESLAGIASVEFQYSPAGADSWSSIGTDLEEPYNAQWDTTSVSDGAYDLRFVVTDQALPTPNVSIVTLDGKIVDNTAPTGSVGAPTTGALVSGAVPIAIAAADATSRVASVEITVGGSTVATLTDAPYGTSWDSTSVSDGSVAIAATITDLAGNSFTTPAIAITVDNSAPTVALADPGGSVSGTVTLTATASADAQEVEFQRGGAGGWVTLGSDTSAPFDTAFVTNGLGDGPVDLRAIATDASGHRGTSGVVSTVVDNTAPTGALTEPAVGATVGGSVDLAATASDATSGVASVAFEARPASGGSWAAVASDADAPYTGIWDTSALATGGYDLRIVVTDRAGNRYTGGGRRVDVDSTAPTVTLADPGSPLSGTVVLTATAGATATEVEFQVSAAGANAWATIATDGSSPWSASFDTTQVADGVYDLRAVARDQYRNARASVRAGRRIDNTAPRVASSIPSDGSTVAAASAITLIATEAVSAVPGATLDGAPAVAPILAGTRVDFATGALGNGLHTLTGSLRDAAGKTALFRVSFTVFDGTGDPPPVEGNTSSDSDTSLDASDGSVTVTMPDGAWTSSTGDWVVLRIDPNAAPGSILGLTPVTDAFDVSARWAIAGTAVTSFALPLDIAIPTSEPNALAATSDGGAWRLLPRLTGTTLPAGQDAGFYRAGGTVHILSRKVGQFALVADTTAPAVPTGFYGTVVGGTLRLHWTPSADNSGLPGQIVLFVDGVEAGRYPTTQTELGVGPFSFADTRTFEICQIDAAGNWSPWTAPLRGLPSLVGLTVEAARTALEARGFTLGRVTTAPSSAPAGTIVEPSAAGVRRAGAAVDVVVSAGPDTNGSGDGGSGGSGDGGSGGSGSSGSGGGSGSGGTGGSGGGGGGGGVPEAPLAFAVAESRRFTWATQTVLPARIKASRAADVVVELDDPAGEKVWTWRISARPGAEIVKLTMPREAGRSGRYTVRWTAVAGTQTVKATRRLDVASRTAKPVPPQTKRIDVVYAGAAGLGDRLAGALRGGSVRFVRGDEEGVFDLAAGDGLDVRVLVLDVDRYGLGLLRDFRTVFPGIRVIAVSRDAGLRTRAKAAGASSAVAPSTPTKTLAALIRLLAR